MAGCTRKAQRVPRELRRRAVKSTPSAKKRVLSVAGLSIPSSTPKTRATAQGGAKKRRFLKPLPEEFRRDGFEYRQVYREGDAAIYEQRWSGCSNPSVCFEVIRIRRREGFQIGARFVEPAEVYPKAEAWGVDGFTLSDKDAAFAKLREISR
jgi:hypothetical protein